MKLQAQTLNYYNWIDIEDFLCREIGIIPQYFRNYHKIIAGSYKDFWHVWLDIVDNQVRNESFEKYWFDILLSKKEKIIEQYGEWVVPLFHAIQKLLKETDSETIVIWYCW